MPIPNPLRDRLYASGALIQECSACHWAQRGHQAEFCECPSCGEALTWPLAIVFGGVGIVFRGKTFFIYNTNGMIVSINRADVAEVAQFICRHTEDRRTDVRYRDAGEIRAIPWRTNIDEQLWARRLGMPDSPPR